MSLETALQALVPRPPQHGCKTCLWLSKQTPKVREFVADWIAEKHSRKQLYDVISAHGYPLSNGALKCHFDHVLRDES